MVSELPLGFTFGSSPFYVVAGSLIVAHFVDDDHV